MNAMLEQGFNQYAPRTKAITSRYLVIPALTDQRQQQYPYLAMTKKPLHTFSDGLSPKSLELE